MVNQIDFPTSQKCDQVDNREGDQIDGRKRGKKIILIFRKRNCDQIDFR